MSKAIDKEKMRLRADLKAQKAKSKALREQHADKQSAAQSKQTTAEQQSGALLRAVRHLQLQLSVRNQVIMRALTSLEQLCALFRNALLHRTCPACNSYPCEGTHVQCNAEMYAAHRGKTVEQCAQEQQAKVAAAAREAEHAAAEGLKPGA